MKNIVIVQGQNNIQYHAFYGDQEEVFDTFRLGKYAKILAEEFIKTGIRSNNYYEFRSDYNSNYIELYLYDAPRNEYFTCKIDTYDYYNTKIINEDKYLYECFWRPVKNTGKDSSYYIVCKIGYTTYKLHKVILPCDENKHEMIDHKDGNTLNNRKMNLRIVSSKQNGTNKRVQTNNNTGFNGITKEKTRTDSYSFRVRWQDKITWKTCSKKFFIPNYPDEETALLDAAYFRENKEIEHDYQNQRYKSEQKLYNAIYNLLYKNSKE